MRKLIAAGMIVLVTIAVLSGLVHAVNLFTPYRATPILSSAMSPAVLPGSLMVGQKTPESSLSTGDIIMVGNRNADGVLVGRLIDATTTDGSNYQLTFKADNVPLPEPYPYKVKDVTYLHSFSVPLLGGVIAFSATIPGGVTIFALFIILMVMYNKQHTKGPRKQGTRRTRKLRKIAKERILLRSMYGGTETVEQWFQKVNEQDIQKETQQS